MNKSLIYLAVPYSHPDTSIRDQRFEAVNQVAARLMREGHHIFSPISHTHPIAMAGDLPTGWDFWEKYDTAILQCCQKLIVLRLDGWEQSAGVRGEIAIAIGLEIPIEYIDL
jgi:hypothetical protein